MYMKLENQLTSLELSKRLDELGVKQDSLFYWIRNFHTNDDWKIGDNTDINNNKDAVSRRLEPLYKVGASAYTVAELGEMLPDGLHIMIRTDYMINKWYCEAEHIPSGVFRERLHLETAKNEAEARAKMLVYLIENKLI